MRAALQARSNGKAVLALAVSNRPAPARAARSHTGALACDGAAIDAACRAAGIERVGTPREMIDAAQALAALPACPRAQRRRSRRRRRPQQRRRCRRRASRPRDSRAPGGAGRVTRPQLPPGAAVLNPIDLAGGAEKDTHMFARVAAEVMAAPELDALLLTGYFGGYAEYGTELELEEMRAAEAIGEVSRATGKPIVAHTMYPRGAAATALRAAGVAVYEAVEQACFALRRLVEHGTSRTGAVPPMPEPAASRRWRRLRAGARAARRCRHPLRGPAQRARSRRSAGRRDRDRLSRRAQGARPTAQGGCRWRRRRHRGRGFDSLVRTTACTRGWRRPGTRSSVWRPSPREWNC